MLPIPNAVCYSARENNARDTSATESVILQTIEIYMYAHKNIHNSAEKCKVYKEKKPRISHPKQYAFSPPASILMSAERNYIYPPVNILRDTYDLTTKGRQYFANIYIKFSMTQFQLNFHQRREEG